MTRSLKCTILTSGILNLGRGAGALPVVSLLWKPPKFLCPGSANGACSPGWITSRILSPGRGLELHAVSIRNTAPITDNADNLMG
ncbi:MAG: hypothetical protein LMBGKNDO_00585 [Bacteroidales bacterium]|nr:hypothetical protein [Bacteroidales bacterium]